MEDLLWGCPSAGESLCAKAGGTSRVEVGKTWVRVPGRKGEREEDCVGRTWCLGDDHHIAREPDLTGCSALERDGGTLEVAEHVHHRGEVQVLHTALSTLREHQAEMLGSAL